jgi:hypothetical protein
MVVMRESCSVAVRVNGGKDDVGGWQSTRLVCEEQQTVLLPADSDWLTADLRLEINSLFGPSSYFSSLRRYLC